MAKKLKVEHKVDLNIQIIGISTTLKDYRMAQIVNKALDLNLNRIPSLPVFQEKINESSNHSLYITDDSLNRRSFYLVQNRTEGWNALPISPPIDYLVIITGKAKHSEMMQWMSGLRAGSGVMMVVDIKANQIKALEGLMTDIEFHLLDLKMKSKGKSGFPSIAIE